MPSHFATNFATGRHATRRTNEFHNFRGNAAPLAHHESPHSRTGNSEKERYTAGRIQHRLGDSAPLTCGVLGVDHRYKRHSPKLLPDSEGHQALTRM